VIRPGEDWGGPPTGPAVVVADERALARLLADHGDAGDDPLRVRFAVPPAGATPCDLARAVGGGLRAEPEVEVPMDALWADDGAGRRPVVNMAVLGAPPHRLARWSRRSRVQVVVDGRERFDGRATTVVVANGQFLAGNDVVVRGHPGDGRAEVQVYALAPRESAALRDRVRRGAHLPHPAIGQFPARRVTVTADPPLHLWCDGERTRRRVAHLEVTVEAGAYRLCV